jgi:hypothetical protein
MIDNTKECKEIDYSFPVVRNFLQSDSLAAIFPVTFHSDNS